MILLSCIRGRTVARYSSTSTRVLLIVQLYSLPGVHGALLLGISIVLRYSYSVGLSIAVVLAGGMCSCAKPPVNIYLRNRPPAYERSDNRRTARSRTRTLCWRTPTVRARGRMLTEVCEGAGLRARGTIHCVFKAFSTFRDLPKLC